MRKLIYILFYLISLFVVQKAKADWPVGKGRTLVSTSLSYLNSSKYFNSSGKVVSFGNTDKFQSSVIAVNLIHGITRTVDFSLSAPFVKQDIITNGIQQSNTGLTDIVAGFSFHFPSTERKRHLTLKAMVIVPAYENNEGPSLGYASKGIQGAINYSFTPFKESFGVVEASYTRFLDFEDGPNQYRGSVSFGKSLNKYSTLTFNYAHLVSNSINTNFNPNLSNNKNFSSGSINIAYGRKLTRTITPYIQGFYTLYGTNAGMTIGAAFFVLIRFP